MLVAILLGATSLYREIELKTIFPILARPIRRHEYLLGKYLGTLATLAVFVMLDAAAVLALLAAQTADSIWPVAITTLVSLAVLGVALLRAKYTRVFVLIPWSVAVLIAMSLLAKSAGAERQLVLAGAALALSETAIVAAVATLFGIVFIPIFDGYFHVRRFSGGSFGRHAREFAGENVRRDAALVRKISRARLSEFAGLRSAASVAFG